jgi:hypothetical protein
VAAGEPVTPPHAEPEPDAGTEPVARRGEAQHPRRPLVARLEEPLGDGFEDHLEDNLEQELQHPAPIRSLVDG